MVKREGCCGEQRDLLPYLIESGITKVEARTMFYDPTLNNAYRNGRRAAQGGYREPNQYAPNSPEWFAWNHGAEEADADMDDASDERDWPKV